MPNLVFIGSHLGYPMDRTPLGGGAMVGLQLARRWAEAAPARGTRLVVVGSGPESPAPEVEYVQRPEPGADPGLTRLSELGYARFCRAFEESATSWLLERRDRLPPAETVLVVNDISESPDLERLAAAGYRIVTVWHVDVVEFFNRIYLGGVFRPELWTRAYARLARWGLDRGTPDVLRLVFDKQRQAVRWSDLMVLPSRGMADTLRRCYGGGEHGALDARALVLPWGGWQEPFDEAQAASEASALRGHYQLRSDTRVVMTLSRISPEKGLHVLLEALRLLEDGPLGRGLDVCAFLCGETAFMRGEAYGRRVRRAAERLRRFRVFFPGYLDPAAKQAYFRLADLFVSPSLHESYGLTVVEGLQAGLPVLASDHHGVDETLRPDYGRAVPYGEPAARARRMAEALGELLADRPVLRAMGEKAREAARGMDFGRSAEELLDAALATLGRPRGAAA
ncbi:MAG: glycosyltransferase family 4 protein [Elusimicrobia bacterium]|nr:glycosyltransferase family 4 protein [Elusimicrobiota bacterium]